MKAKKIANIIAVTVLFAAAVITAFAMHLKIQSMEHENAAKRISNGTRFSQITLFLPESAEFTVGKARYFEYELDKKLTEKSVTPENDGARLYVSAYSLYKDRTLTPAESFNSKRSADVKMLLVGGDYALFHPELADVPRVTGDVNHDRILLSRTAAWRLFGGSELYDFEVVADEKSYFVSGVFADFEADEYSDFLGDRALCISDMAREPDANISVYEILLVNPVTDFAKGLVTECIGLDENTYYLVENSSRFSVGKLFKKIPKLLDTDTQLPNGVTITPEEISALKTEKELCAMLILVLIFSAYPVLWLCILLYRLIKLLKGLLDKFVFDKIRDKLSYS